MAIDGYMVNGTAFVYVGTGAANALELLGYTEDGVEQGVQEYKGQIITDLFGPQVPQDFQDFGMTARLICPFIAMDRTILGKVMNRGDRTILGQLNTPGLVLGMAGYAFRIAIASTFDSPWSFYKCVLNTSATRLATKANPFRQEFFCWPWVPYTASTGKDAPLWSRSLS